MGAQLKALSAETFGRWGQEAVDTVRAVAKAAVERTVQLGSRSVPASVHTGRAWEEIGIALQRGNAAMIRVCANAAYDRATSDIRRHHWMSGDEAASAIGEAGPPVADVEVGDRNV